MTTPHDPWSFQGPPPFEPSVAADDEADGEQWSQEDGESTFDRPSSDALTVPISSRGMTRPLSLSRATPRTVLPSRRLLDHSSLPTFFLGIGVGAFLTGLIAALVIVGMASSAPTRRAQATVPKATHSLPTVTPTRTPTPTPVPSVAATFGGSDAKTQGTWQGVYGGEGAIVIGDTQQLPSGIQVTPSGAAAVAWAPSTADPRAPQKLSNPADRIAACWYAPTSFSIDVTITDGQAHRVALYLLDWDSQNRSEVITVTDPATGASLDTRIVTDFVGGVYQLWAVRGHVVFTITNNAGSVNAVLSALYFSPA